jgi:tetratricopeptide (TPR) repeat protein
MEPDLFARWSPSRIRKWSEAARTRSPPDTSEGVAWSWSDAKALFNYRGGNNAGTQQERFFAGSTPRLATGLIIRTMGTWRLKDYWGAMVTWTKGYALVQAGARQGLVTLTVGPEIFPGVRESDFLQAPWYDWAVAELLVREWDEMIRDAEQTVSRTQSNARDLDGLAIVRAASEWHALRGEWSEALRCAEYCLRSNHQDTIDHATVDYVNAAIASLESGDEKNYLRIREEMGRRFIDTGEVAPWRALEIGLLRPVDDSVSASFEKFATGLARWSQNQTSDYWGFMLVSLHCYRKGDYAGAMDMTRQSLARLRDGTQLPAAELSIIRALCLNQQGNQSAALSELVRAESAIQTGFRSRLRMWHWRRWIVVRLLLQEARAAVPHSLPDTPSK